MIFCLTKLKTLYQKRCTVSQPDQSVKKESQSDVDSDADSDVELAPVQNEKSVDVGESGAIVPLSEKS